MIAPLLGFFFCMVTVLAVASVLLTSLVSISSSQKGSLHLRPPVIGRAVMVETQRHSPVAKEASAANEVTPVVTTATADIKKSKHYKPKVFARQRDHGNALGYVQESGWPRGFFFR
jgi:hypothetical protein